MISLDIIGYIVNINGKPIKITPNIIFIITSITFELPFKLSGFNINGSETSIAIIIGYPIAVNEIAIPINLISP